MSSPVNGLIKGTHEAHSYSLTLTLTAWQAVVLVVVVAPDRLLDGLLGKLGQLARSIGCVNEVVRWRARGERRRGAGEAKVPARV